LRLSKDIAKDLLMNSKGSKNKVNTNFLSIDFSTDLGSLFLKVKNKTFSRVLQSDKFSNDLLMKHILDFFKKNNLNFADISKIFVNQGPGNFSGLRSSLAVAKGISLSKNLNLIGYNTFLWTCSKYFGKNNLIFSLIKFRKKYFVKKFDRNLNSLSMIEEITEEKIMRNNERKIIVIPQAQSENFDKNILQLKDLKLVDLDHNELVLLQLNGLLNEDLIKPLYLI
jgi:tRNA threonylcarbamoyl adenosine modification protein YeaZ